MSLSPSLPDHPTMGIYEWGPAFREVGIGEGREWAIGRDYRTFLDWTVGHPERRRVSFLTAERARLELDRGASKGRLHRLEGWETSPARELAERLEA